MELELAHCTARQQQAAGVRHRLAQGHLDGLTHVLGQPQHGPALLPPPALAGLWATVCVATARGDRSSRRPSARARKSALSEPLYRPCGVPLEEDRTAAALAGWAGVLEDVKPLCLRPAQVPVQEPLRQYLLCRLPRPPEAGWQHPRVRRHAEQGELAGHCLAELAHGDAAGSLVRADVGPRGPGSSPAPGGQRTPELGGVLGHELHQPAIATAPRPRAVDLRLPLPLLLRLLSRGRAVWRQRPAPLAVLPALQGQLHQAAGRASSGGGTGLPEEMARPAEHQLPQAERMAARLGQHAQQGPAKHGR
mmetsp:Transcript_105702/g.340932  ORF Transcript_105702/g.340932 Transcript_105702/m.340932 type:complete len:307 (+) Transcript_105702:1201-2121(+)